MKYKSTEINHHKECYDDPYRLIQVIIVRNWVQRSDHLFIVEI
jgi:hypothetical protein